MRLRLRLRLESGWKRGFEVWTERVRIEVTLSIGSALHGFITLSLTTLLLLSKPRYFTEGVMWHPP